MPMMAQPDTFTCFHCWETFDASTLEGQRRARDHFGETIDAEPACQIKAGHERNLVMRLRRAEAELARYHDEDGPKDREMIRLRSEHAEALKRAEEQGFARGVADMRKHGWRLNEETEEHHEHGQNLRSIVVA